MMKRFFAIMLSAVLLLGVFPLTAMAQTPGETVLLAFGDFQPKDGVTKGQARLESILNTIRSAGIHRVDGLLCNGDYSVYYSKGESERGIRVIKNAVDTLVDGPMVFTKGNHDPADSVGLALSGNNDAADGTYGVFVINENDYSERGTNRIAVQRTAVALRTYLEEKLQSGWDAPIFVVSHIPLHWGNLTMIDGTACNGFLLFDVLNYYGYRGLNIIHLYGHSHAYEDDYLGGGAVYLKKGDKILIGQSYTDMESYKEETLYFTYMNPGYTGYYSTDAEGVDTTLTATLFRIKGNEVVITRYDGQGEHNLKSAGVFNSYRFEHWPLSPEPNTTVYPSSRRVTATEDVEIETPPVERPVGLVITTPPSKTLYRIGSAMDLTGMQLTLVYEDGTTIPYRGAYSVEGFTTEIEGVYTATVVFEGLGAVFTYEVVRLLPGETEDPDGSDEPFVPDHPLVKFGWYCEDGRWAYYNEGVKQTNQWRLDSVGWCYLGADGYCVTNAWVRDSKGWCYLGADGRMVTRRWVRDSVGWCYVGYNGYCVTNKWMQDSVGWVYLGSDGRMLTNRWVRDSVGWCYVGEDGYCVTDKWVRDYKSWCYLDSEGRMVYDQMVGDYYVDQEGYCWEYTDTPPTGDDTPPTGDDTPLTGDDTPPTGEDETEIEGDGDQEVTVP